MSDACSQVDLPSDLSFSPVFFDVTVTDGFRSWVVNRRYRAFDDLQGVLWWKGIMPQGLALPAKHPKPGSDRALLINRAQALEEWSAIVLATEAALAEATVIAFFDLPRAGSVPELVEAQAALVCIQAGGAKTPQRSHTKPCAFLSLCLTYTDIVRPRRLCDPSAWQAHSPQLDEAEVAEAGGRCGGGGGRCGGSRGPVCAPLALHPVAPLRLPHLHCHRLGQRARHRGLHLPRIRWAWSMEACRRLAHPSSGASALSRGHEHARMPPPWP